MSVKATVIVPTVLPERALRLLDSLPDSSEIETIIVDNGTGAAELDAAASKLDGARVLRQESNLGYSRAVNLAARQAQGEALVLLNDDSIVEPDYVERIAGGLDPRT